MGQIHNVVLVGDPDDDEQDTVVLPYLDSKEMKQMRMMTVKIKVNMMMTIKLMIGIMFVVILAMQLAIIDLKQMK